MYMPRKDIDKKNKNSKSNAKEPVVQFNINEPVMTMLIDGNNMTVDSMQFNNTVVQPFDKAKKIDQDLPVDFVKQQVKDIWDRRFILLTRLASSWFSLSQSCLLAKSTNGSNNLLFPTWFMGFIMGTINPLTFGINAKNQWVS